MKRDTYTGYHRDTPAREHLLHPLGHRAIQLVNFFQLSWKLAVIIMSTRHVIISAALPLLQLSDDIPCVISGPWKAMNVDVSCSRQRSRSPYLQITKSMSEAHCFSK